MSVNPFAAPDPEPQPAPVADDVRSPSSSSEPESPPQVARKSTSITMFGVGNAGINVLEQVLQSGLGGVRSVALDTDPRVLADSSAVEKLQFEKPGATTMPGPDGEEQATQPAEALVSRIKSLCAGADVVFVIAGLGGSSGLWSAPMVARAAKEAGSLVLAFVTTPFDCEGGYRRAQAVQGLGEIKAAADGVICLPNQKAFKLIDENTSFLETFRIVGEFLADAVRGVWRLLSHPGLIQIHFGDLCALVRDRHTESFFAVAEAMGPTRSREVVDSLLAHPMLESGQILGESEAVLVSLLGGPDLTMTEVNRVVEQIQSHCPQAQIIMGAAIDESYRERLSVTLIAARKGIKSQPSNPRPQARAEGLETQLLKRSETVKPNTRFLPPAPSLPAEEVQQMEARQQRLAGVRPRKPISKMQQSQLPLEIVSKGRFDKSEPTIHKGEDLDVPTYIRRGVALN